MIAIQYIVSEMLILINKTCVRLFLDNVAAAHA